MHLPMKKIVITSMMLCCSAALAQEPVGVGGAAPVPAATCVFSKGFPKAGSVQGEIDAVIEWANCNGVDKVVGGISKTVNKAPFLVKSFQVNGTVQAPLLATGSYSWNLATGEATGTVITSGTADAFKGAANLASNGGVALNVTVP